MQSSYPISKNTSIALQLAPFAYQMKSMKESEFSPQFPGKLVTIQGGHAFLPELLSGEMPLGYRVWRACDLARGALGEFVGQSRRVSNEALVTLPLLTMEAIESNRIEGTHTQAADVLRQHAAGPPADKAAAGRNQEVLLYRETLQKGEEWLNEGRPISESLIKGLHGELLHTGRGDDKDPGRYRNETVLIGRKGDSPQDARFVPPPYEHVTALMANLVQFFNDVHEYPELIASAIGHYQFETIHPFKDGNGRIGRLLVPLHLMAKGIIDRPILYLSVFFEARRDEYYDRLKRVSTHGDWDGWILFFLEAVHARAVDSTVKVERIRDLQESYGDRVRRGTRSQAALAAIDLVMRDVFVTIPQIRAYAGCSYNTAKAAVEQLQELGILVPVDGQYPATWGALELLTEVYGN